MSKRNIAFISFAEQDKELARSIKRLFSLLHESTFYSTEDLGKVGSPQWREAIIDQIESSYSFIPIYTRNSINRPWVLYESGIADAYKLNRFPALVSNIMPNDIDYLPSGSVLYYYISEEAQLADLVINVCSQKENSNRTEINAHVNDVLNENKQLIRHIIELSRIRRVFIAGNVSSNAGIKWYTTLNDYEMRLKNFTENLTEELLNSGFSIAACPQVKSVGMHVTHKALSCLATKKYSYPVRFSIGGIYPIDREAREIELSENAKTMWLDHILNFRKTYLHDHEWLILIAGNKGTQEEFKAASECGLKIFAVRCFGGTAMKIYENGDSFVPQRCAICNNKDGLCGSESIKDIVKELKEPPLSN